jgi:ribosomal protein L11 methyltransferase
MNRKKDVHPDIWEIELRAPARAVARFADVLEPLGDSVSWRLFDPDEDETDEAASWLISLQSRAPPDRDRLNTILALAATSLGIEAPEFTVTLLPTLDWVAETMRSFAPVKAGRFWIHGSHIYDPPPKSTVPLMIDAGTAFGSGEHPTTRACLEAFDRLLRTRRFRRIIDIGCGTGILAMAAAKSGPARVIAADIDANATRVARFNARQNGLRPRIETLTADGLRHRRIARGRGYDLMFANILARPLAKLARPIAAHAASGGCVVLSGLLTRQERQIASIYRSHRLQVAFHIRIAGWSALVLSRQLPGH